MSSVSCALRQPIDVSGKYAKEVDMEILIIGSNKVCFWSSLELLCKVNTSTFGIRMES